MSLLSWLIDYLINVAIPTIIIAEQSGYYLMPAVMFNDYVKSLTYKPE